MFLRTPDLPPEAVAVLQARYGVSSLAELPYDARKELLVTVTRPLWAAGDLSWLLDRTQLRIRSAIEGAGSRKFLVLCSRRLGKSFLLVSMAVSVAMRKPNSRVLYLAPTKQNAREIASDLMASVLEFCPPDLKPEFKAQDHEFHFKNGAVIRLRGVNGETADNLRGSSADLIIADEFGFWDEPENVIQRVALPMTITTGGRIVCATTPPEDPSHYSAQMWADLLKENAAIRFTLLDADPARISAPVQAEYLKEAGEDPAKIPDILAGRCDPETTTALREYWARFVADTSRAIIPEFTKYRTALTQPYVVPPFRDLYTALDPGFVNHTAVLYGFSDFFNNRLVVEAEDLLHKAATPAIATTIRNRERELWDGLVPYLRVSDIDLRLIADLMSLHGLEFQKAQKQDLKGGVNLVRALITGNQLAINPACVNLLAQMEMGVWNRKATEFQDSGDGELGHLDLLAALVYLVRAWWINRNHNPYPPNWRDPGFGGGPPSGSWISPKTRRSTSRGLLGDTPLGKRLHKARYGK